MPRCRRNPRGQWGGVVRMILALATLLVPSLATAADAVLVKVTNTTGTTARDLHVTFTGTGGNIKVDPASVFAPGCPVPAVPSNPPVVTSTAVLDWGVLCVPPGGSVEFVATTTAGPLAVSSAVWTGVGGAVIGPAFPIIVPVPPGGGPFWALKFASRCKGGKRTYSFLRRNEEILCIRCCRAPRTWKTTTYICYFASRLDRLLERGRWVNLGTVVNVTPAKWKNTWWWSWGGFGLIGSCGPSPQPGPGSNSLAMMPMPVGPPPTGFGDPAFDLYDPEENGLDPRYSDDQGNSYRRSADFTSVFGTLADSLDVPSPDSSLGVPPPLIWNQFLMTMGARYRSTNGKLATLMNEVGLVNAAEPNPTLVSMGTHLAGLQNALQQISTPLLAGNTGGAAPYQNLSVALQGLSNDVLSISAVRRFQNAARELQFAAVVAQNAASLAGGGLPDSIARSEFGYALHTGIPDFLRHFSAAMSPHMLMDVIPCGYAWNPTSIDAALAVVMDEAGAPLDSVATGISEAGAIYIPNMDLAEGTRIRLKVKLPNFLSEQVNFRFGDGEKIGPLSLIPGDANNDDCVNGLDQARVNSNLGAGGYSATTRPPQSDVNGDGLVDFADLAVVGANFGACGPRTLVGVPPPGIPERLGFSISQNPGAGRELVRWALPYDALVKISVFDVAGRMVRKLVSPRVYLAGGYELGMSGSGLRSGVYFLRMESTRVGGSYRPVSQAVKWTVVE